MCGAAVSTGPAHAAVTPVAAPVVAPDPFDGFRRPAETPTEALTQGGPTPPGPDVIPTVPAAARPRPEAPQPAAAPEYMPGTALTWTELETPPQRTRRRPAGLLIGAGVGVLALLGVGGFLIRHTSVPAPPIPVAAATSSATGTATASPSRTKAVVAPPVTIQTTAPTDTPTTPAPTPTGLGAADTTLVASDPRAPGVGQTFTAYFTAIDSHQYGEAYNLYSDAYRGRTPESRWEAGLKSTQDGQVSVQQIEDGANAAVLATVQFTSHQAPADAPDHKSTCTVWNLKYTLLPGGNGVPYEIDSNKTLDGVGYRPC